MASPSKRRSRVRKRSHARSASAGAILGAAAALTQVGCGTEEGLAPPIDYDAQADGGRNDATVPDASPRDAEPESTLVDLDGEADAGAAAADGSHGTGAGEVPEGGGQGFAEVS